MCFKIGMDPQHTNKEKAEKLVRLLQANPEIMEPMEALLSLLENEKSLGGKADDIEEQIIEHMRSLGRGSLQSWAHRANELAQREAKGHTHLKKKSAGSAR